VMRDRGMSRELIERAKAAGCSALLLTVDLAMQGQRDRDVHNGLSIPPTLNPSRTMMFRSNSPNTPGRKNSAACGFRMCCSADITARLLSGAALRRTVLISQSDSCGHMASKACQVIVTAVPGFGLYVVFEWCFPR